MVGACDFWPQDLEPLAESISRQVAGETTAWLVAGDVILIDVAGSPRYTAPPGELETLATEIAAQAIAAADAPLESIVITFHEGPVSTDRQKMREFIILVMEGRPVLQPYLDIDATGPLTRDEVQAAVDRLGESLNRKQRDCVRGEITRRAQAVGDPELLDPARVDSLSPQAWNTLDPFARRLILAGALGTKALFACVSPAKPGDTP